MLKWPARASIPVAAFLIVACANFGGTVATTAPIAPSPTAHAVASSPPTAMPATATATATTRPTSPAEPPKGMLSDGGNPVEGWLGSYCWQGTCADAGGIPAKTDLPTLDTADNELTFSLSEGSTFVRWTASYGESSDGALVELGGGGAPFDPDAQPQSSLVELNSVGFESPPAGDWSLLISVRFSGGDLSYAWHVVVPET